MPRARSLNNSDSTGLNHHKPSSQSFTALGDEFHKLSRNSLAGRNRISEKNHPTRILAVGKNELAEILILGQEDSFVTEGKLEHCGIFGSGGDFGNGQDIMTGSTERTDNREVAALIRQKARDLFPGGLFRRFQEHRLLMSQCVGRVPDSGLDIFAREPRVSL